MTGATARGGLLLSDVRHQPAAVDFDASPRRPHSIRRTTTHDSVRPDGLHGPVTVIAQGRDLFTRHGDTVVVVDQGRVELRANFREGSIIGIASDPADHALDSLVGSSPFSGFRASLEALLPGERAAHTVRFRLLYDLAPALLVSGRALRAAGVRIEMSGRARNPVDICAGWAEGGSLLAGLTDEGPPLHIGPDAAPLSLPATLWPGMPQRPCPLTRHADHDDSTCGTTMVPSTSRHTSATATSTVPVARPWCTSMACGRPSTRPRNVSSGVRRSRGRCPTRSAPVPPRARSAWPEWARRT